MSTFQNGVDVKSKEKLGSELCPMDIKDIPSHGESWRNCCFKNMLPFSSYYGIVGLLVSALGAYLTSQLTTIEKQFGLSSSQSGLLLSMNDAAFMVTVLFASYFGRNGHIPRILALCGLLSGLSAFICIIPHFFSNQDIGGSSSTQNVSSVDARRLCSPERVVAPISSDLDCSEEDKVFTAAKSMALGLISLGMFLQGIATAPRQPLSQIYVDDNVPKHKTGMHIGIIVSLSVVGPALSFGIGGSISQIYVTLEETDMSPRDPRWIGAWWLGFVVFGALAVLLSFPMFLFPKKLDNAPPRVDDCESKSEEGNKLSLRIIIKLIKGVLRAFGRLVRRPVWAFMVLATGINMFKIFGVTSFTPKYMQMYYGLSILKSNVIVGFVSIGASAGAIFLSGVLARLLKLELRGMIRTVIITQVVSAAFFLVGIFLECPQTEIRHFQMNTGLKSTETVSQTADMDTSCFRGCHCDGQKFFPICGSDDVTYFSPCHAGCQTHTTKGFIDCLCITNGTELRDGSELDAVPGTCQHECPHYVAFVVIQSLSSFIGALSAVPCMLALLRSVDEKDKSLSLGANSFVTSALGWFLGPIVMGVVVDTTCKMWNSSCSEDGSCAVYDLADFRYKLHGLHIGASVLCITVYIFAYLFLTCRTENANITQYKEEEVKPPSEE